MSQPLRGQRPRVSHACNACRRRKVKCNSEQDCNQCLQIGLKCIYTVLSPDARSRKSIVQGRVIETCEKVDSQSTPSTVESPISSQLGQSENPWDWLRKTKPSSKKFSTAYFEALVDDYCTYVLPTIPIIGEKELRQAIQQLSSPHNDGSLVYVLAGQTLNLTQNRTSVDALSDVDDATTLFLMALNTRKPVLSNHHINVHSIIPPMVSSLGLYAKNRDNDVGYFYAKEAIAGVSILRVDDLERQASFTAAERRQRERLHWLMFIHERFHCIGQFKRAELKPLASFPEADEAIPLDVTQWFHKIIRLFLVVDDVFLINWMDKTSPTLTLDWIEKKQAELAEDEDNDYYDAIDDVRTGRFPRASSTIIKLNDMQQVDLLITRYWFRTLIWQMTLAKFPLTSDWQSHSNNTGKREDFMSLAFPVGLSHRLRHLLAIKPQEAIEIHGTGMLMKIFEITCSLADIIQFIVANTVEDAQTRSVHLECFLFLHSYLLKMSKFYSVERNYLAMKFDAVNSLFTPASMSAAFNSWGDIMPG